MESFVSRKDRIVASAIDIISESGLDSLTTRNLALKENMSESLLYKYFGGIDEVLIEVVDRFTQFDDNIKATVEAKNISYTEKLIEYFDTYATYYGNYPQITALVLNYEELLHNYHVREKITKTINLKNDTVEGLIQGAIDAGEIVDYYTAKELLLLLYGTVYSILVNRRVRYQEMDLKDELNQLLHKTLDGIRKRH